MSWWPVCIRIHSKKAEGCSYNMGSTNRVKKSSSSLISFETSFEMLWRLMRHLRCHSVPPSVVELPSKYRLKMTYKGKNSIWAVEVGLTNLHSALIQVLICFWQYTLLSELWIEMMTLNLKDFLTSKNFSMPVTGSNPSSFSRGVAESWRWRLALLALAQVSWSPPNKHFSKYLP